MVFPPVQFVCSTYCIESWMSFIPRRCENWCENWRGKTEVKYGDGLIFLTENSNVLKQVLMKVEEERAKMGFHLNIKKINVTNYRGIV